MSQARILAVFILWDNANFHFPNSNPFKSVFENSWYMSQTDLLESLEEESITIICIKNTSIIYCQFNTMLIGKTAIFSFWD